MRAGFPIHNFGRRYHGAQRHAGGNALGNSHNVRLGLEVLDGKHFAGTPHAGLDFIGDIKNAVFFCNSGAEANEAAIKIARRYGNQKGYAIPKIIVMENAFHGRTMATLSATGNPKVHEGFTPLVDGFIGFVPIAYEKHIKTNKDWEGIGVKPDISINPSQINIYKLSSIIKQ